MTNLTSDLKEYLSRNDTSKNEASSSISLKTFGKFFNKNETADNEVLLDGSHKYFQSDCCPTLSRFQRILGFFICIIFGTLFFSISFLCIPLIVLKARKFALLFTLGSCSFVCSYSFLWGPWNFVKQVVSKERLPFTTLYFGSLIATLYFAIWVHSTPLTALSAIVQIVSLVWYLFSYIPGGQTGLSIYRRIFSSAVTTSVSRTLPV